MLNFTTDQWVIIALIFVLGLLIGGFLFSGGGRKWKHRYNSEVDRRKELERLHGEREKEWREQDSLRAAALKDQARTAPVTDSRDLDRDGVVDRDERRATDDRKSWDIDRDGVIDRDGDGIDDRRE
jgi:hypothetical protein